MGSTTQQQHRHEVTDLCKAQDHLGRRCLNITKRYVWTEFRSWQPERDDPSPPRWCHFCVAGYFAGRRFCRRAAA